MHLPPLITDILHAARRCTSLLICGIATDRAIALLRRSKQAGNAYARPLLIAAVTCNALGAVNVYASVISWMITQDRTEKALSGVKIPDVLYPLFSGLTGYEHLQATSPWLRILTVVVLPPAGPSSRHTW